MKRKLKPIDARAMMKTFDYLDPTNPIVVQVCKVAKLLTRKIDQTAMSVFPRPNITLSDFMITFSIGSIPVWDSENDERKELTADKVWKLYLHEIEALAEVMPKKRRKQ